MEGFPGGSTVKNLPDSAGDMSSIPGLEKKCMYFYFYSVHSGLILGRSKYNGHEFEQALGVGDGQGSLACCSPWGLKESDMTE